MLVDLLERELYGDGGRSWFCGRRRTAWRATVHGILNALRVQKLEDLRALSTGSVYERAARYASQPTPPRPSEWTVVRCLLDWAGCPIRDQRSLTWTSHWTVALLLRGYRRHVRSAAETATRFVSRLGAADADDATHALRSRPLHQLRREWRAAGGGRRLWRAVLSVRRRDSEEEEEEEKDEDPRGPPLTSILQRALDRHRVSPTPEAEHYHALATRRPSHVFGWWAWNRASSTPVCRRCPHTDWRTACNGPWRATSPPWCRACATESRTCPSGRCYR